MSSIIPACELVNFSCGTPKNRGAGRFNDVAGLFDRAETSPPCSRAVAGFETGCMFPRRRVGTPASEEIMLSPWTRNVIPANGNPGISKPFRPPAFARATLNQQHWGGETPARGTHDSRFTRSAWSPWGVRPRQSGEPYMTPFGGLKAGAFTRKIL